MTWNVQVNDSVNLDPVIGLGWHSKDNVIYDQPRETLMVKSGLLSRENWVRISALGPIMGLKL